MSYLKLTDLMYYNDGLMYWKETMGPNAKSGSSPLAPNNERYLHVYYKGKSYKMHRIVFLYHYGYLPDYIDHIDGDKANNKIENLRECTASQNQMNRGKNKNNTSNYKGVSFHKQTRKWRARSAANGKRFSLGLFTNPLAAASAVVKFEIDNHDTYSKFSQEETCEL